MSEAVRKYHEEEEIGKTYDFRVARRLFRYLRPYWGYAAAALVLTLVTNILISTQPFFTKMAVDEKFRGKGIGESLIYGLIDRAREMKLKRVILYSNTILEPAIRLYRRLGFREITLEKGLYERSNIKMEIEIESAAVI